MIAIVDFGSQYTMLISRKVKELGVKSRVFKSSSGFNFKDPKIQGIILSGSPASISQENPPLPHRDIFSSGVPVLGICYGMQAMIDYAGGRVGKGPKRGYGKSTLEIKTRTPLLDNIPPESSVWMSHSDRILELPPGFTITASTGDLEPAVVENPEKNLYGIQFHPEVTHTLYGNRILSNFLFNICRAEKDWSLADWISLTTQEIKKEVEGGKVVMALSGGVDSSVVCALLSRAVKDDFFPFFVDHGLMRKKDTERIKEVFIKKMGIPVTILDTSERFFEKLQEVSDPEKKRKIIGNEFIKAFVKATEKIRGATHLAQGTIFPDIIESAGSGDGAAKIKSHHNVGGLPEKLDLKLLEPLKELYKDEVREIGRELGLPEELIKQHPFPGPGLGVRILGPVDRVKAGILKKADAILDEELKEQGLYYGLWQGFCVFLPVKTVGVMGDSRTYENVIAIRCVNSTDAMTASWADLPHAALERISTRIVNEVEGVNRVVLDITNKPPGTIEWE